MSEIGYLCFREHEKQRPGSLSDAPKELCDRFVERLGECVQGRDRKVFLSSLHGPDVGAMQAANGGELFL